MFLMDWMLILFGHVAIACVMFNHVHATASPNSSKISEKAILVFAIVPLVLFVYLIVRREYDFDSNLIAMLKWYFLLAKIVAGYFVARWVYRATTSRLPNNAKLVSSSVHDFRNAGDGHLLFGAKAKILGALPANQVLKAKLEHWDFNFPQLPTDLDGFKICQLSDLHFTGLIGKEYFERVFELVNQNEPDVILVSGDIIENEECLDWIEDILTQLTARHGVYYVFGNHDLLIADQIAYRERLYQIGWKSLSDGIWRRIDQGDSMLLLSGNEFPWYSGAKDLPKEPFDRSNKFLLLLSHSPDQIGWAVSKKMDLVFAGHTHGGQIRLPIVGPIIAPSKYGIKYASGTFRFRDTMMHVSRGLSGDEPIRINCLPEIGFFTLKKSDS